MQPKRKIKQITIEFAEKPMKYIMPAPASQQFKELKELFEENNKKISDLEKKSLKIMMN